MTLAAKRMVDTDHEFVEVYKLFYRDVRRWALALGTPSRDIEDVVQNVFMVARRRLPYFNPGSLGGWLYRITWRAVRDLRRKLWFKNVVLRGSEEELENLPLATPQGAGDFDARETLRCVYHHLEKMTPKRRETLLLFELEGYTGEEIATLQRVPVATVWTRLHHARNELRRSNIRPAKTA